MLRFVDYLKEDIWIGHKLNYEQIMKHLKNNWGNDDIWAMTKRLKDHSGSGEYGQFCKDYPEYVVVYWVMRGRKMQPTKDECIKHIEKNINRKFSSLSNDEKEELLKTGWLSY